MSIGKIRTFDSGATRDSDEEKADYEGYLSPLVIERFGQYMLGHQKQSDGSLRASDNWQHGIPRDQYMKSAWRHFIEWWRMHRAGYGTDTTPGDHHDMIIDAICGVLFNTMGYLHEKVGDNCVTETLRPGQGIGVDDVENPIRITYMGKTYVLEAPDQPSADTTPQQTYDPTWDEPAGL